MKEAEEKRATFLHLQRIAENVTGKILNSNFRHAIMIRLNLYPDQEEELLLLQGTVTIRKGYGNNTYQNYDVVFRQDGKEKTLLSIGCMWYRDQDYIDELRKYIGKEVYLILLGWVSMRESYINFRFYDDRSLLIVDNKKDEIESDIKKHLQTLKRSPRLSDQSKRRELYNTEELAWLLDKNNHQNIDLKQNKMKGLVHLTLALSIMLHHISSSYVAFRKPHFPYSMELGLSRLALGTQGDEVNLLLLETNQTLKILTLSRHIENRNEVLRFRSRQKIKTLDYHDIHEALIALVMKHYDPMVWSSFLKRLQNIDSDLCHPALSHQFLKTELFGVCYDGDDYGGFGSAFAELVVMNDLLSPFMETWGEINRRIYPMPFQKGDLLLDDSLQTTAPEFIDKIYTGDATLGVLKNEGHFFIPLGQQELLRFSPATVTFCTPERWIEQSLEHDFMKQGKNLYFRLV